MKNWPRGLLIGLLLGVLAMLAGCSGAGLSTTALTQSPAQQLAATHMNNVQLLRGWLGIMYPPPPPPPTGQADRHRERPTPDTLHFWGTDSYGHAYDYTVNTVDQSGSGTWSEPSGIAVSGTWGPVVWTQNPRTATQHTVYNYPGMTLQYDDVAVFPAGSGTARTRWEGTVSLTDGRSLTFRRENNAVDRETLRLQLAAANVDVTVAVPIVEVIDRGFRPAPGQPATGTAQSAGGPMALELRGVDGAWDQWRFTGADGTVGSFALGDGMAGSGRLEQGGKLLGALNWPDSLVGRLDLTSLGTVEVTPAAAARDLSIERWITSLSGLGPGGIQ